MHVRRHGADLVDFLGDEVQAENAFDEGHDDAHVQRQHDAADHAQRTAQQAHQRALDHENLHDGKRRGAQGAQNGDVGLLVGDRHHQGRDQVERGHGDDHAEDDEHHVLLALHQRIPAGTGARPVAHPQLARHRRFEFARHLRRLVHVVQTQTQAGRAVELQQLLRISHVDEGQAAVKFIVARLEDAGHLERAHARHDDASGRVARPWLAFQHQGHVLPHFHIERLGQVDAQHDVVRAWREILETALLHLTRHAGDGRFLLRQHAAHDGRAHGFVVQQHALRFHERRHGFHLRVGVGGALLRLPVWHGTAGVEHLDVGQHRHQTVGDFLLEAVHDGEDDDQGGHAQADTGHGNEGNEGNEAVAATALPGARIAHADLPLEGKLFDDAHALPRQR